MKKRLCSTVLSLLMITCFTTCKKDGPSTTLPEATQEGKNTFGMKVNGEVWTPYAECGFGQNPCGALSLEFHTPYTNPYSLYGHFTRTSNSTLTSIIFSSSINSTISTVGNKYDTLNVIYGVGLTDYIKSSKSKGQFIITKLDFAKEIISGTFNYTLYRGNDSIVITDGRFDCKFRTCVCN